jgi:hypothetical protein
MKPEEIRELAASTSSAINRSESGECPSGTSVQILLLAEIAAQFAELNQRLRDVTRENVFDVYVRPS